MSQPECDAFPCAKSEELDERIASMELRMERIETRAEEREKKRDATMEHIARALDDLTRHIVTLLRAKGIDEDVTPPLGSRTPDVGGLDAG